VTRFETRPADWLSLPEARERVLALARSTPPHALSLELAEGLALAAPVYSPASLPRWDTSAMDGYAVRRADVEGADPDSPRILPVVGVARPGSPPERTVGLGEAVRIMTGAPIPPGVDTVIRVEDTDGEETEPGRVCILRDRDVGRHIRSRGKDAREGERLLTPGATVGPGVKALLAGVGVAEVEVHRRPRVAILSTGDELVGPDRFREVLEGAAVPDTNGPFLTAAVRGAGGEPLPTERVPDRAEALQEAIARSAAAADLLLVTGGASMGEGDLVKRVLDGMGFRLDFWRVRIRPGSPFSAGTLPRGGAPPLPVLGLPGNPASAFVTFQLLARPLLLAQGGHTRRHRPTLRARAGLPLLSAPGLTHLVRVTLEPEDGGWVARPTGPQGSGLLGSLAHADALALVPEGVEEIAPGEEVEVMLLGDGPGWSTRPEGGL